MPGWPRGRPVIDQHEAAAAKSPQSGRAAAAAGRPYYGFAIIRFTCNEIEIHLLNMQYALSTRTTLCVKGYVKPDRMCGPVDYTVPWGSGSFQSANDSSLSERQGCALPRQQSSKLPPSCPCTTRRRGD